MGSPQIELRTKLAAAVLPFEVDVSQPAVEVWQANSFVAASAFRRPSASSESADGADHSTGYVYQTTAEGQTGAIEPAWPTTGTVKDGSITWSPVVPLAAGEDSIASGTWTQVNPPDSALTITTETVGGLIASAYVGGGTSGLVYTINVAVTMTSGAVYVVQLIVTVL